MISAQDIAYETAKSLTMPEVYVRIRELMDDPESKINDYVDSVNTDPALAARVIRIANSDFFGYARKVDSVYSAISLIGVFHLRDLILASLAMRSFSGIPNEIVDLSRFWRNSIYCGVLSRLLAKKCSLPASEGLFALGVLHDIGHVIIYSKLPEFAHDVLITSQQQSTPVFLVERRLLGFDYGEVGSELMRLWRLPYSYQETTRHHPEPQKATQFRNETAIVYLARILALECGTEVDQRGGSETIDPIVWKWTNLSPEIVEEVKQEACNYVSAVAKMLLPQSSTGDLMT